MQTKQIWLVLDSSNVGGIETHVMHLAKGLTKQHFKVLVVLLKNHGQHPLIQELQSHNIELAFVEGGWRGFTKLVSSKKPDVIHTHGYKAGIWGRLLSFKKHIRVVNTFHAGETSSGKVFLYDLVDRYSAFLADKVLAVSDKVAAKLPCKSRVVDNFINTDNLQPSSGQSIAFVGRLSHEKGPDYYLHLAKQMPQNRFHVYGDGNLFSALQELATSNVIFHGAKPSMQDYWKDIGVVIMPSRFEGLPMVALEAMARGIPVIAFDVGALHRVIEDGKNGWLVPAGDTDALFKALSQWLKLSQEEKTKIKNAASKAIEERFSIEACLPKIVAAYA